MRTVVGREPTRDQLLAMAYVDGELAESARREFEDKLRREPVLMGEVAELKRLVLLVSQVVSADPVGFEMGAASTRLDGGGGMSAQSRLRKS